MRLFKDIFEETGKQNGVVYTNYNIATTDLSKPATESENDEIYSVREMYFGQVKDYCADVAKIIILENECELDNTDMITVYRMRTTYYITNERYYEIFVPNWWD